MKIQTPRQYLKDAAIWGGGINLFLNLLAGWLIYRKTPFVPMQGQTSITGDSTVMVWLIVFFSLILAVPGIKKAIKEGKLLRYESARPFPGLVSWFFSKGLVVATAISFLCVFTLVPLVLWLLRLAGVDGLATWPFLGYKSALATFTAATVIPLIDWLVIRNESAKK